jgi:rhodanese-related sulfurtransferase
MFLARQGYPHVYNIAGGIDAWSREVDARVPLY